MNKTRFSWITGMLLALLFASYAIYANDAYSLTTLSLKELLVDSSPASTDYQIVIDPNTKEPKLVLISGMPLPGGITASAAELNILDGATVTTAEVNILDGVTSTAAELNILDGVTSIAAELNILDGATATFTEINYLDKASALGVQEASKVVTADANVNSGISKITELHIGATGAETQVDATGAELNEAADKSAAAVVSLTGNLALTQALHAGRVCTIDKVDGIAITLPEATGTGDVYTLILGTALTSSTVTITTADTTNADYVGHVIAVDLDAATTAYMIQTVQATGDDIITMNMTTQGGVNLGCDYYILTDIATDVWKVKGKFLVPTGSNPATPFSGT